ncbi:MAG: pectate lyase [Vicinamibacterales bacterium]
MSKHALFPIVAVLLAASPLSAQPSADEVKAAMKKAAAFMVDDVSYRGGYVWAVSEDLKQRWGEVPARPTQIWVQSPGTPSVGMAFLDAYDATRDPFYLQAARRAADALVFGQHPLGGWHYFIDFDPAGLEEWYSERASKFLFGYEEYRHYYGNATNDDQVTSSAAEFLLRFYTTTMDTAYRAPLLKALEFVLAAQYPNGAWPQRFPLRYEFAHDGLPDYTSYYTLNDGVMQGYMQLLVKAYRALGDQRYLEAARRGADFMIAVQGPEGQAAWAEQYGPDMRPIAARTHEPAGYVIRESRDTIRVLEMFYVMTGDPRYLRPIPGCLAWFDRVNREALELGRPPERYWEPGTNLPIYVVKTDERNADGYGVNKWTTTPPAGLEVRAAVDVAPIRREYETVAALKTRESRDAYFKQNFLDPPRRQKPAPDAVEAIIAALDSRGAWVTDDVRVHPIIESGMNPGTLIAIRGISTAVFIRNLTTLTAYLGR